MHFGLALASHAVNADRPPRPLRRYQRLLADAAQRVYRVLPAFETDDLDRAYDVAEGARLGPSVGHASRLPVAANLLERAIIQAIATRGVCFSSSVRFTESKSGGGTGPDFAKTTSVMALTPPAP